MKNTAIIAALGLSAGCTTIGLKTTNPDSISDDGDTGSGGETVDVSDGPVLDAVDRYRNEDLMIASGLSLPGDIVTLTIDDGSTSYEYLAVADDSGAFSAEIGLVRGVDTTVTASNEIGADEPAVTQACTIWDAYELDQTSGDDYGDTCEDNPVIVSDDFSDDLSLEDIYGNILTNNNEDWYRVVATDSTFIEDSYRYENYRFQANFIEGADSYEIRVFRNSCEASGEECAGESYTEYSYFADDTTPDENGDLPDDPRACGGEPFNDCADFTATYYVVVRRTDGALDCTHYKLRLQNGNW